MVITVQSVARVVLVAMRYQAPFPVGERHPAINAADRTVALAVLADFAFASFGSVQYLFRSKSPKHGKSKVRPTRPLVPCNAVDRRFRLPGDGIWREGLMRWIIER